MALINLINSPSVLLNTSWFKAKYFTNFGYKPDEYNEKDVLFRNSPMANAQINENASVKQYFKQISNQYSLGSCTANATADSFEAMIAKRKNLNPYQVEDISRLFVYYNARNLDTPPDITDHGSRIRLAFDSMARYGAAPERVWAYDESKVNVRPSILSYREAIKYRINAFYRIRETGDIRVLQIKQALSAGYPVVFGARIADSFRYINSDTVIMPPSGGFIGGHAMCLVSDDSSRNAFELRNSWGESWGKMGYGFISYNYIKSDLVHDIWVPTV